MLIEVVPSKISSADLQKIVDHYNLHKSEKDEPLELLDRCEDGFQIKISYMKDQFCDINNKIKQLRWKNKCLTSDKYIDFTFNEKELLCSALKSVLGENNVKMILKTST
jgi:hypothetical protein